MVTTITIVILLITRLFNMYHNISITKSFGNSYINRVFDTNTDTADLMMANF